MKTLKIRIFGVVQGVGFRYSAQKEAEKYNLDGWVKNESDGSVTAEVTGPADSVEAFRQWCTHGPSSAKVEDVKVEEKSAQDQKGFNVVR